jgi:hypothetical protein
MTRVIPHDHAAIDPDSISDSDEDMENNRVISGAINNMLSGENIALLKPMSNNSDFQSVSLPLGATVDRKIKAKIWDDQYVDLNSLIKDSDDDDITFTLSRKSSFLSFASPNHRSKPIEDIQDWTNAFLTLVAIYTERHPTAAPKILKYIKTVRDMESHRGNWVYYDTQFRKLKSSQEWSWDFIHWELHFSAMSKSSAPSAKVPYTAHRYADTTFGGRKKPPFLTVPNGFCRGYHKTGKCLQTAPCPYKHLCFKCKKQEHPSRWCISRHDAGPTSHTFKVPARSTNPSKRS